MASLKLYHVHYIVRHSGAEDYSHSFSEFPELIEERIPIMHFAIWGGKRSRAPFRHSRLFGLGNFICSQIIHFKEANINGLKNVYGLVSQLKTTRHDCGLLGGF